MSNGSVCVELDQEIGALALQAVESGSYASLQDIITDALQDWQSKHQRQQQELQAVKTNWSQLVSRIKTSRA